MRQTLADLRYAWRGLRRAPIFTVVAVLSIALGIGANTAIFTLLDQVALRLLPVKDPRQLVMLSSTGSFPGNVRARDLDNRRSKWISVFGRLRPGVSAEQADAVLQPFYRAMVEREIGDGVFANVSAEAIAELRRSRLQVQTGSQGRLDARLRLARPLWVLMASVCGVLLIACANVANLLLARAMTRQREIAVRLALGASRGRLVRHLLIESLLLALMGATAGIGLATLGAQALLGFLVQEGDAIPLTASPDWRVLAFTAAIAIATGLIFGLVPALQSTRPRLAPTLSSSRGVAGGSAVSLKKALVIAQVALSLLLLIGAGLFTRSLRNLATIDPGFRTHDLLTFAVNPGLNGYTGPRRPAFYKAVRERLLATPGVTSVAFSSVPALGGQIWASTITIAGYQRQPGEEVAPLCNAVSPGYFRTLGIPFLAGHDFTAAHERADEPGPGEQSYHAVIVSETFVKRYLGGSIGNAIGRRIGFTDAPNAPTPIEIIGVVKDAKYEGVRDERASVLYFPYLEHAGSRASFYARATPEMRPELLFGAVRRAMQETDPNLPVVGLRTLAMQLQGSLGADRLIATLSVTFSVLATLLAMVGLYGVTAYSVTQRTREIGIRMALGATARGVAAAIARDIAILVAIGMAIALPVTWAIGGYVRAQLYDVSPMDPAVLIVTVIVLAASAGFAGLIPARRAARIDPVGALRHD